MTTFRGKQRQDAFAAAASIFEVYDSERDELIDRDDDKRSDRDVIKKTRDKINKLTVEPVLKQLLLDMTGTNESGTYSKGNNLYGNALLKRLKAQGITPATK